RPAKTSGRPRRRRSGRLGARSGSRSNSRNEGRFHAVGRLRGSPEACAARHGNDDAGSRRRARIACRAERRLAIHRALVRTWTRSGAVRAGAAHRGRTHFRGVRQRDAAAVGEAARGIPEENREAWTVTYLPAAYASAVVAQPVPAAEMNWSRPNGKPLSK